MSCQHRLGWFLLLVVTFHPARSAAAKKDEPAYLNETLDAVYLHVWLALLQSDNVEKRRDAAITLAKKIGPEGKSAVPSLIEALKDKDAVVQTRAAEALGQIGPEARAATPALIGILQDKTKRAILRASAAKSLGQIGAEGKRVVPVLIKTLTDKNNGLQSEAAGALGKFGCAARTAAPALVSTLKDRNKDEGTRANAARSLGQIGAEAKLVIPVLITALDDEKEEVQTKAAEGLGAIGPKAREAIPALGRAFERSCLSKRQSSLPFMHALGRMGRPAAPKLIDAARKPDWVVRYNAVDILGDMGSEAYEAVPILIKLLTINDDYRVGVNAWNHRRVCQALGKIGACAKRSLPILRGALHSDDMLLRRAAAWAIVHIDPGGARQAGIQQPFPLYAVWISSSPRDLSSHRLDAVGGGFDIDGKVVVRVNGKKLCDFHFGGDICYLETFQRLGKNELVLAGRHRLPVYIKITRETAGGKTSVVATRVFSGPIGKGEAETLPFEVKPEPALGPTPCRCKNQAALNALSREEEVEPLWDGVNPEPVLVPRSKPLPRSRPIRRKSRAPLIALFVMVCGAALLLYLRGTTRRAARRP